MESNLDEKDWKIIDILQEHSDYTTRKIAKKTNLPQTTVHNRIVKLRKEGIIEKFTIKLNPEKIGKSFAVQMLVSVDYDLLKRQKRTQHDLANEIKKLPEVERVDIITGDVALLVRARLKDVKEFDDFLLTKFQKIAGITHTRTLVIIHET